MKKPRLICPSCGSVSVDQGAKGCTCLNCGNKARRFPSSTDPMPTPSAWDGRARDAYGRVLPKRGAQ